MSPFQLSRPNPVWHGAWWGWVSHCRPRTETTGCVLQGWTGNVRSSIVNIFISLNPLTPNDPYRSRTILLTSKGCILYIYSTNIGTEYFKHGIYPPLFSLQNAVCFIILTYLVPVLFTFYLQCVLKLKKNNPGAKRLNTKLVNVSCV